MDKKNKLKIKNIFIFKFFCIPYTSYTENKRLVTFIIIPCISMLNVHHKSGVYIVNNEKAQKYKILFMFCSKSNYIIIAQVETHIPATRHHYDDGLH